MNIWIALSINLVIGTDATINLFDPLSNMNYILSGIRCTIALLSILFSLAIYKKVKFSQFTILLQLLYQMQLASEIRQTFTSLNSFNIYKYLLLLYYEHQNKQLKYLQYITYLYCMIEIQFQNTQIHQYTITTLIFIIIILFKTFLNSQQLTHKNSTSNDVFHSYSTVPAEIASSNRKIDQISRDELINILNHSRQGIIYFGQNLEIQYMNEKTQKLLQTKSNEIAMYQLQKIIIQGIEQDENQNTQHKEIKSRASQKHLLQKADCKMIESLIASAEQNLKRFQSMSEKILDSQFLSKKQKKNQFTIPEFRQLLLSLFSDTQMTNLLDQRTFIKANKLKVNLTSNHIEKIIELQFCKIANLLNQGGYLLFIQDVTENERLQQYIQKQKFQTLHFNSFSHELRTPLNCSLTLLQALKTQQISNQLIHNYLNPAIVSNKLLMHQINDILDYASFGLGTFQLNIRDFLIKDLFKQLEEYYMEICSTKCIKLIFSIFDSLENHIIYNDPERILQLLVNLINNSLKFTRENDVICVIAKSKQKSSGIIKDNFIKFIIHDTGRGIAKTELDAINNIIHTSIDDDIYHQLKNFTTKYVGLGFTIGNRMSNELAYSKKSYFKIRSKEGLYTKVSFRINNQITAFALRPKESLIKIDQIISSNHIDIENSSEEQHHIPFWTQTFFSNKMIQSGTLSQILICDDVVFNLISLNLLIKNLGYESDTVYDGYQAINQIKKRKLQQQIQYKMIFMDIEMPGLNGYQTSTQLLQIDDKLNIIMCSAYDTEDNLSKALESGMKDFIIKPVRIEQLKVLIKKYIK
ncbi:unnamed protein product [Paramecium pentaurelia]|uniref:Uncharacterized protein n=1 Tax=Paramecium pentaurelia TaxID=43138 RepID=A0A8S1VTU6_9CILI|nr:unnamed protein product [Paramecium pentaurelia]